MKVFEGTRSLRAALAHSAKGEQALHVWQPVGEYPNAPKCFKRYKVWGHLFDQDAERLQKTVKALGVNVIVVEHEGKAGQHVDLCGKPLETAIKNAELALDSSS